MADAVMHVIVKRREIWFSLESGRPFNTSELQVSWHIGDILLE